MSKLFVVGIGPGDLRHMTFEAREAVETADIVVGYKTYLDLIKPLLAGKKVVSSGMTKEVERCAEALRLAASGKSVALVSGGDAGVYGMAWLALELADAALSGANMNMNVVERKVRAALKGTKCTVSQEA